MRPGRGLHRILRPLRARRRHGFPLGGLLCLQPVPAAFQPRDAVRVAFVVAEHARDVQCPDLAVLVHARDVLCVPLVAVDFLVLGFDLGGAVRELPRQLERFPRLDAAEHQRVVPVLGVGSGIGFVVPASLARAEQHL